MPLLDHFHPPPSLERHWESFHAAWAGSLADALNPRLPEGYFAEEQTHAIDVLPPQLWAPPAPALTLPAVFADDFEVRVFASRTGPRLVAAIELISPRNKDRPEARRAFAIKCASYHHQGISLILVDIVTGRRANLHNELLGLLGADPAARQPDDVTLYAAAYRPLRRQEREEIDVWPAPLALGGTLPALPLALSAEVALPVDLEATYTDACQRRRLA
jgi:hypothetical protein